MVGGSGVRFPNVPRLTQFNIEILFFLNDDYSTRMLALFTDKYLREITLCLSFSDNTRTSYLSSFHKQLRTGKRKLLFYEMFIVYRNREFFCLKNCFSMTLKAPQKVTT